MENIYQTEDPTEDSEDSIAASNLIKSTCFLGLSKFLQGFPSVSCNIGILQPTCFRLILFAFIWWVFVSCLLTSLFLSLSLRFLDIFLFFATITKINPDSTKLSTEDSIPDSALCSQFVLFVFLSLLLSLCFLCVFWSLLLSLAFLLCFLSVLLFSDLFYIFYHIMDTSSK